MRALPKNGLSADTMGTVLARYKIPVILGLTPKSYSKIKPHTYFATLTNEHWLFCCKGEKACLVFDSLGLPDSVLQDMLPGLPLVHWNRFGYQSKASAICGYYVIAIVTELHRRDRNGDADYYMHWLPYKVLIPSNMPFWYRVHKQFNTELLENDYDVFEYVLQFYSHLVEVDRNTSDKVMNFGHNIAIGNPSFHMAGVHAPTLASRHTPLSNANTEEQPIPKSFGFVPTQTPSQALKFIPQSKTASSTLPKTMSEKHEPKVLGITPSNPPTNTFSPEMSDSSSASSNRYIPTFTSRKKTLKRRKKKTASDEETRSKKTALQQYTEPAVRTEVQQRVLDAIPDYAELPPRAFTALQDTLQNISLPQSNLIEAVNDAVEDIGMTPDQQALVTNVVKEILPEKLAEVVAEKAPSDSSSSFDSVGSKAMVVYDKSSSDDFMSAEEEPPHPNVKVRTLLQQATPQEKQQVREIISETLPLIVRKELPQIQVPHVEQAIAPIIQDPAPNMIQNIDNSVKDMPAPVQAVVHKAVDEAIYNAVTHVLEPTPSTAIEAVEEKRPDEELTEYTVTYPTSDEDEKPKARQRTPRKIRHKRILDSQKRRSSVERYYQKEIVPYKKIPTVKLSKELSEYIRLGEHLRSLPKEPPLQIEDIPRPPEVTQRAQSPVRKEKSLVSISKEVADFNKALEDAGYQPMNVPTRRSQHRRHSLSRQRSRSRSPVKQRPRSASPRPIKFVPTHKEIQSSNPGLIRAKVPKIIRHRPSAQAPLKPTVSEVQENAKLADRLQRPSIKEYVDSIPDSAANKKIHAEIKERRALVPRETPLASAANLTDYSRDIVKRRESLKKQARESVKNKELKKIMMDMNEGENNPYLPGFANHMKMLKDNITSQADQLSSEKPSGNSVLHRVAQLEPTEQEKIDRLNYYLDLAKREKEEKDKFGQLSERKMELERKKNKTKEEETELGKLQYTVRQHRKNHEKNHNIDYAPLELLKEKILMYNKGLTLDDLEIYRNLLDHVSPHAIGYSRSAYDYIMSGKADVPAVAEYLAAQKEAAKRPTKTIRNETALIDFDNHALREKTPQRQIKAIAAPLTAPEKNIPSQTSSAADEIRRATLGRDTTDMRLKLGQILAKQAADLSQGIDLKTAGEKNLSAKKQAEIQRMEQDKKEAEAYAKTLQAMSAAAPSAPGGPPPPPPPPPPGMFILKTEDRKTYESFKKYFNDQDSVLQSGITELLKEEVEKKLHDVMGKHPNLRSLINQTLQDGDGPLNFSKKLASFGPDATKIAYELSNVIRDITSVGNVNIASVTPPKKEKASNTAASELVNEMQVALAKRKAKMGGGGLHPIRESADAFASDRNFHSYLKDLVPPHASQLIMAMSPTKGRGVLDLLPKSHQRDILNFMPHDQQRLLGKRPRGEDRGFAPDIAITSKLISNYFNKQT